MIGAYAQIEKTWIDTPPERQDRINVLLRKNVIKQAVGGAGQKSEILAIPSRYKYMLDDLVDSSNLEHPEILHPNGQRQRDPTPNLGDNNNPSVGQEEYRKERGVKGSKARERRRDDRMEQVRGDRMSKVRVHHVLQ